METNGADKQIKEILREASHMPLAAVFRELETSEQGLTDSEVKRRRELYGPNEIAHDRPPTWYMLLLKSFVNPFNFLLSVLAIISLVLEDYNAAIIIAIMVSLSVGLRFVQEFRSNKAAEKLKALVSTKATVLRRADENSPPQKEELDIKQLVPGDIILLSAGDMLPGDVRLVSAKGVYVSQSALSGESLPVEKDVSFIPSEETTLIDSLNMCFLGTDVLNGTATAVVVATGNRTYFGSVAKSILGYRPLTSFDIGVNSISWLLIQFMFFMIPVVFFINGFTKGTWGESFLFALSVAVGLTPEMLPMIVTTNLARGAIVMARSKVIVKRLNSIQNFGAMDVLCTDKTGTLTQDHIILEKHVDINGEENNEVLEYAYLNSYYQTGLKNLLDIAVLEHKEMTQLESTYKKYDEIPFDFLRRRMSVIVNQNGEKHLLICKGAVEEILNFSKAVQLNGNTVSMSDELRKKAYELRDEFNNDGLRVLAVAYKELPSQPKKEYYPADENELVFLGFIAFLDPPKQSAIEAIELLKRYHVKIKVLTGDSELVTRKICNWVNLPIDNVLTGSQIDKMGKAELKVAVEKATIFAKLSPLQKSLVILTLKENGHTVGYLGDGINDAPALREADVGISVDTAVDIAKESADIIMLEKSLLFLGEGVVEGRKTFGNIIKYIKMAVSSNFGNVFSVLGASAILPFLPMMPVQLLVQNLLYDLSQTTIPFDYVDKEFLVRPRKWNPGGIARFMLWIGPISSIFDYTTFALMWFIFGANTVEKQALFQSGWFVEGLLSQTLIVHMIRTQRIPFIQSIASPALLVTTAIIMTIGIILPYTFVGGTIGLVPLPWHYFPWLILTLLCYCILTQIVKYWYIKKYHRWL